MLKDTFARPHVCTHQFLSSTIHVFQFELTLPQAQMQEWASDRSYAMHRIG